MKIVIYARISSNRQSENSIEAQLRICRAWAKSEGHIVVREYVDLAQSAKTADRIEFQKMLKAVLAGQAAGVLVHKFDRFSRNREDSVTIKAMLRRQGKQVLSVSEPIGESPSDKLLEGMLEAINEFYLLNLAAESQKGMTNLAKNGIYPHQPPMGYYRKDKLTYVDEKFGPLMTEAFSDFATGKYTLRTWTLEAHQRGILTKGGNKIHHGNWARFFRNRFYLGEVHWMGEVYAGKHQPLTDEETFQAVQTLMAERMAGGTAPKSERHKYPYSKYLFSEVHQRSMSGNTVRNRNKNKFFYYRSVGDGPEHNVQESQIEHAIYIALKRVRVVSPEVVPVGETLALAIRVSPNIGVIFRQLREKPELQKELLEAVLPKNSLSVNKAGKINILEVNNGFLVSERVCL